jgi:hypothetical protein
MGDLAPTRLLNQTRRPDGGVDHWPSIVWSSNKDSNLGKVGADILIDAPKYRRHEKIYWIDQCKLI